MSSIDQGRGLPASVITTPVIAAPVVELVVMGVAGMDDDGEVALAGWLDDEERARAARFHFARHRRIYIAAHALLRAWLGRRLGLAPTVLRFTAGARGKPDLAPSQMPLTPDGRPALRFNLSHTAGMVAIAVTADPETAVIDLGVDVEAADRLGDYDARIARGFFAEDEAAALEALPDAADRARRFLTLWTLKESVIKATGAGLSQALSGFSIRFPAGWPGPGLLPDIEARDPPLAQGLAWHLMHQDYDGMHLAAGLLCQATLPPPHWRITPMTPARLLSGATP
ncbi:4'-phosphopantetheinyl transferase superfamily protein [Tistrella bauzanensis]|nr:4'-phosphopantetheinyl transferase superfamily protein [Tistrella bauzanensis]